MKPRSSLVFRKNLPKRAFHRRKRVVSTLGIITKQLDATFFEDDDDMVFRNETKSKMKSRFILNRYSRKNQFI